MPTHAIIDGVKVPVVKMASGKKGVCPPYAGGGYVLEDQWHLLSNMSWVTE